MHGLDISSTKYLEMTYFLDSLIVDSEARLAYFEKKFKEFGVDINFLDDPSFSSSSYFDPKAVDFYIDQRKHELEVNNNLHELKRYYLNLLSISEFTLFNSTDKPNKDINSEIQGKSLKKLKLRELERSKISSDLHDSIIQTLTGLVHQCEFVLRLTDFDITRTKMEVSSVIDDLKSSISELRSIIFNLRAPSLSDFSLIESVEDYCNYKNRDRSVVFSFSTAGDETGIYPVVKSNVYRICQEAINNILYHSQAKNAEITISYTDDTVFLSVKDNGIGIPDAVFSDISIGQKHFGLLIMKERSEIIGGNFTIGSLETGGTEIKVSLPKVPEDSI